MDPRATAPQLVEPTGAIQMLSVAFDGNHFKGEIVPELERLKREGVVRIVDLLFVRKDSMGNVMVTRGSDLGWEEAVSFGAFVGALAGAASGGPAAMERASMEGALEMADGHLFSDDDLFRISRTLPTNMSAAVILLEHLWTRPLFDAVARADGFALTNEWIHLEDILAAGGRAKLPGSEAGE